MIWLRQCSTWPWGARETRRQSDQLESFRMRAHHPNTHTHVPSHTYICTHVHTYAPPAPASNIWLHIKCHHCSDSTVSHGVQVQATLDHFHFIMFVLFPSTTGPLDVLLPVLGILSPLYLITFHSFFNFSSTITTLPITTISILPARHSNYSMYHLFEVLVIVQIFQLCVQLL